jgi:hypothetical protein
MLIGFLVDNRSRLRQLANQFVSQLLLGVRRVV